MVQWWISLVLMIMSNVWAVEQAMGAGNGPAKKTEAVAQILAKLADPNVPLSVSKYVPKAFLEWLIGFLIDLAANALQGFFGK